MKKILFFAGVILLFSCAKSGNLVKLQSVQVGNDTTTFAILTQDYLANAESRNSIAIFNSEEIKIDGTFCDIMSKDSLKCIPNTISVLSAGLVSKISKKSGGKAKSIIVNYSGKNYVYSLHFVKSKNTNGVEEFVFNGKVIDLVYKGNNYSISGSSVGVCKLLVQK